MVTWPLKTRREKHQHVHTYEARKRRPNVKSAYIVYRALHGAAPQYLSDRLQYVADLPTRRRVASAHRLPIFSTSARHDVGYYCRRSVVLPILDFGTVYLLTSGLPRHLQHFVGS